MNLASPLDDILEWDVKNWSLALNFWQAHLTKPLANCNVLEIGSRHGGLSLWLASQGARVVCSDAGDGPTPQAVLKHRQAGVAHLVEYRIIDATNINSPAEFDLVVFKSVLGSIGYRGGKNQQAKAIGEMHRVLKPGGALLFAENLVGSPLHTLLRRSRVSWGSKWRYISLFEAQEFLSPFSSFKYQAFGFAGAFGPNERLRQVLGVVDQWLLDRLVPNHWKYILAGVARKQG